MINTIKKLMTRNTAFETKQVYEHKSNKTKLFRLIEEVCETTYKYLLVNEYGIIKSKQLIGSTVHLFDEYSLLDPKHIDFTIVDTKAYKR